MICGGVRVKGRRCKCGFCTIGGSVRCPRCGKITSDAEWGDGGTVLSSAKLNIVPNGFNAPMALVMVEVEGKGPKVTCWSEDDLTAGEKVTLTDLGGCAYICERQMPRTR